MERRARPCQRSQASEERLRALWNVVTCVGRASTIRQFSPRRAHSFARNSPTGPAPTIRTSVSIATFRIFPPTIDSALEIVFSDKRGLLFWRSRHLMIAARTSKEVMHSFLLDLRRA